MEKKPVMPFYVLYMFICIMLCACFPLEHIEECVKDVRGHVPGWLPVCGRARHSPATAQA